MYYSERFNQFYKFLHQHEGDYSNHPLDTGGATIRGIASKVHPRSYEVAIDLYRRGLWELFDDYVKRFYFKHYYDPDYDKIEDESLAYKLFDFGINAGVKTAVKKLQKIINQHYATKLTERGEMIGYLGADGFFGSRSLIAVNEAFRYDMRHGRLSVVNNETKLYNYYVLALDTFYKNISSFKTFGRGWLRRLRMLFNNGKLQEGKY